MVKRNGSGERKERENKRSEIGNIFLNIGIRTENENTERYFGWNCWNEPLKEKKNPNSKAKTEMFVTSLSRSLSFISK